LRWGFSKNKKSKKKGSRRPTPQTGGQSTPGKERGTSQCYHVKSEYGKREGGRDWGGGDRRKKTFRFWGRGKGELHEIWGRGKGKIISRKLLINKRL